MGALEAVWPSTGVRIHVAPGQVVRLTGPNGSGKTTLLRGLAGLETHVDVRPRIDGSDPRDWPARRIARRVAYVPQDARQRLAGLTVAGEARLRGHDRIDPRPVANLSQGEASRLAMDWLDAPIWLLDEPATHLDGAGLAHLRRRIRNHGGTVLFTDHTGRLADLADTTLELAPSQDAAWHLPAGHGPERLRMDATRLHETALPAIRLPEGAHVVAGPNGSGKTSLLRALAGLSDATPTWDDAPIEPGIHARLLGPDPFASLSASRVRDLVPAGPLVPDALLGRHPWTLSSGEAQRVALARVLSRPAPVLLLDEPDAHLDGAGLVALAKILATRGGCILIASHDPNLHPTLRLGGA